MRVLTFQSHYGAIATKIVGLEKLEMPQSFNPTMVRLRRQAYEQGLIAKEGFNPTMVRLRHLCGRKHVGVRPCRFNPTMVRLRQRNKCLTDATSIVSIPLWCDCDQLARQPPTRRPGQCFNPTMVRLRPTSVPGHLGLAEVGVSIPLWCDCD